MANPIKYSELFQDDGGIDKLIAKINTLETEYKDLGKTFVRQIEEMRSAVSKLNTSTEEEAKAITNYEKKLSEVTDKLKQNKQVTNEIAKLKAKSIRLKGTEAEVEQSLRLTIQEQNKELKNSLIIAKQKEGSLKRLEVELKKNIELYKNLSPEQRKAGLEGVRLAQTIKNQKSEIKTLNLALVEEKQKIGEVQKAQNKLTQLQTDEAKVLADLKLKIQDKNRELKNSVIIENQEKGSLKRLEAELRRNIDKWKGLSKAERENGVVGKKLLATIQKQDEKVKKLNQTIGRSQGLVGNYKTAFQGLKNVFMQGLGALGITAGIAGIARVITSSIGIFRRFEEANSNLRAVLGATEKQMESLEAQAKNLGATTVFTANQVTQLQTEFARLGFPVEDIQNMTSSTLDAASALKSDLGEQAKLTGAILKQYGLDSTESARVNDVLAKATASSALNFSKLAVQMPIVGATARTAGVSLERTTALLGILSDRGLEASRSSTALRNIFLELSKQGLTYEQALEKINTASDRNAVALDLFGKRGATAAIILAGTTKSVDELEVALDSAAGAAKEMADIQRDNLSGSLKLLTSAWEGFILSLENGKGSFATTLKNIINVATEILSLATGTEKAKDKLTDYQIKVRDIASSIVRFSKMLKLLVISFAVYRVALIASVVRTKLLVLWTNRATTSMKFFNKATKANVIGFFASLLVGLIASIRLFTKETNSATEAQKSFNAEAQRASDAIKSIEARYRILGRLSRKQLESLKADILEQIDLDEKRAVILKTRAKEIEKEKLAIQSVNKIQSQASRDRISEINKEIEGIKAKQVGTVGEVMAQQKSIDFLTDRKKALEETLIISKQLEKFDLAQLDAALKDIEKNEARVAAINKLLAQLDINRTGGEGEQISGVLAKNTEAIKKAKEELNDATNADEIFSAQNKLIELEKTRADILGETLENQKKANKELNKQTKELREDEIISEIKGEEEKELEIQKIKERNRLEELKNAEGDVKNKSELETEILEKGERDRAAIRKKFADEQAAEAKRAALEQQNFVIEQSFEALERIQQRERDDIDRKISNTEKQVSKQQELAINGLDNTLAFEEAERAKLELKKIQADRKAIRLEKVKALYSAYSAAAGSGDDQAIVKVIRDFAIIQGLEASISSFGAGTGDHGTIADAIDSKGGSKKGNSLSNGIFKGESHAKRGRGIPVFVEGGEGILSTDQMNVFGKDNFMKLTQSLGSGVLGSDFFGSQIALVPQQNVLSVNLDGLRSEMNSVKKAIENKPVQQVNVENLSKSYTDFIETTTTGNRKLTSRYRVNKRRV